MTMKSRAAQILGFDLSTINYVWGTTVNEDGTEKAIGKVHLMGYGEEFKTVCGVGDVCGFWPFASASDFDSESGCKNCKRILAKKGADL